MRSIVFLSLLVITSFLGSIAVGQSAADQRSDQYWEDMRKSLAGSVESASSAVTAYGSSLRASWGYVTNALGAKVGKGYDDTMNILSSMAAAAHFDTKGVDQAKQKATKIQQWRDVQTTQAFSDSLKANSKMDEAQKKIREAVVQTDAALGKANASVLEKVKQAEFDAQIRLSAVQWDLSTLKTQDSNINQVIMRLESKLDKSIMGAYFQEKVSRLLSSDNLCKAAASCANDPKTGKLKNSATFSLDELKDIFPYDTGNAHTGAGTKKSAVTDRKSVV